MKDRPEFSGSIVSGHLDLPDSEMLCMPSKDKYAVVDLAFQIPGHAMNICVIQIYTEFINFENMKVLGFEILNRCNAPGKAKESLVMILRGPSSKTFRNSCSVVFVSAMATAVPKAYQLCRFQYNAL